MYDVIVDLLPLCASWRSWLNTERVVSLHIASVRVSGVCGKVKPTVSILDHGVQFLCKKHLKQGNISKGGWERCTYQRQLVYSILL